MITLILIINLLIELLKVKGWAGMFIAVDSGGTFTDIIAVCDDGEVYVSKVLTSVGSPWKSISDGVKGVLKSCSDDDAVVFHATTVATNMLLGQRNLEIAKTALLVTRGFRDFLHIARQNRPKLYDPFFEKPRKLVPDEMIFEVDERTLSNGEIIRPPDEAELRVILESAKSKGAESVAIVFINSYVNPHNELMAERIASRYFEFVVSSSRVAPVPREYERASTAVINAILMPRIKEYLFSLWRELNSSKVEEIFVMSSSGGLINWSDAVANPSAIIESGPAAGVIGASVLSSILGYSRVIAFDMGGTTAKASSVIDGLVALTNEYEVGGESHHGRVVKGSGYPLKGSFVDLAEVSSGGGTVIWRDKAGALRVGPQSVGASPGPMCYGLGGVEPTITDANVALGRIPPGFISGGIKLDGELALKGLSKLGDPYQTAYEAIRLANLEMARAIRLVTTERGHDPGTFSIFAYGGGGPLHATGVAGELGISQIVIPPFPGLFSSLGLLLSDFMIEVSDYVDKDLSSTLKRLESTINHRLGKFGAGRSRIHRLVEARYKGQGWELLVELPEGADLSLKEVFDDAHEKTYGYALDEEVEAVVAHVVAVAESPFKNRIASMLMGNVKAPSYDCQAGYVPVFMEDRTERVPVYCRASFEGDDGPAVIVDYGSTIFVEKGWRASRGEMGTLVLRR